MEKYETLETVGEGTYGIVYKGRLRRSSDDDITTARDPQDYVAIKKFRKPEGKEDSVKRTAARETSLLRELKHPNIVDLHEVVRTQDGTLYLIFEFARETLLDLIERHSPDASSCTSSFLESSSPLASGIGITKTLTIARQLVSALEFVHSKGVVHRDIKPENILLTGDRLDTVKLCDFGFARHLTDNNDGSPSQGTKAANLTEYVSTRWYRAPELLVGPTRRRGRNGTYKQSIDVWALGCVVAECDSGEPAFPGDSDIATLKLINDALPVCTPVTRQSVLSSTQPRFIKERYNTELHSFLAGCLTYDSNDRLCCSDLAHLLDTCGTRIVTETNMGALAEPSGANHCGPKRKRADVSSSCEGLTEPGGATCKRHREGTLMTNKRCLRTASTPGSGSDPSTSASGSSSMLPTPTSTSRKSLCKWRTDLTICLPPLFETRVVDS